ncbi:MAG: stage II sporulation protein R [Bacillota bacterium]|nr:stage II sporulation protein R [Bacillota bacterium]
MGGHRKQRGKAAFAGMLLLAAAILSAAGVASGAMPGRDAISGGAGRSPAAISPDYVRIQVVANSDSAADQHVKAAVRDLLRNRLTEPVLDLTCAGDALAYATAELPELEAAVRGVLAAERSNYDCELTVGVMAFPAKSYGGLVVPPGEYPALRVALGQGRGANWWCVLFPPLCFVDIGSSLARDPAEQLSAVVQGESGTGGAGVPENQPFSDDALLDAVRTALEQDGPAGGRPAASGIRLRSWILERFSDSRWWARLWQTLKTRLAAGADE